jgi:thioredoxin reductase (NADPH)
MSVRDVIVVGAGPSGLATAIAASQAGLDYTVLEKGMLVNSIYQFPVHMSFFTTPELLEIGGLPLVTPYEKPTRIEALRYYRRVAEKFDLQLEFGRRVIGLERDKENGVLTVTSVSSAGTRAIALAPWCLRSATTIIRTGSGCQARTCRTCRITTATRTRVTGSGL